QLRVVATELDAVIVGVNPALPCLMQAVLETKSAFAGRDGNGHYVRVQVVPTGSGKAPSPPCGTGSPTSQVPPVQDQDLVALFLDAFGAGPVVVMAQPGPGASLITPDHIVGLSRLDGKLHQAAGVKKVYGPGALVNTLAISTTTVLLNVCAQEGKSAEASARQQAVAAGKSQAQQDQAGQQAFQQAVSACAQRYAKAFPSLGVPAVNNPTFIQGVL